MGVIMDLVGRLRTDGDAICTKIADDKECSLKEFADYMVVVMAAADALERFQNEEDARNG
jgi:hypothetical protein